MCAVKEQRRSASAAVANEKSNTTTMIGTKERIEKALPSIGEKLGRTNRFSLPRLVKVVVSSGTGRAKDKTRNEHVAKRLAIITGQKASPRRAKQSIASFKLREGDVIGYAVTLRGARMYAFVDKFIHASLPRTKDFKGVAASGVDGVGNLTIGIKEHTIFPETADEELRDIFGLAITLVTTAHNREEARALFDAIGVPFSKAPAAKQKASRRKKK